MGRSVDSLDGDVRICTHKRAADVSACAEGGEGSKGENSQVFGEATWSRRWLAVRMMWEPPGASGAAARFDSMPCRHHLALTLSAARVEAAWHTVVTW